jgi:hypothetical protein
LEGQIQDPITNGFDDVEFASTLAKWGYHDLADIVSQRIIHSKTLNEEKRITGSMLQCSLLQIQGDSSSDPLQKEKFYKEALSCYRSLESSARGIQKLQLQMEISNVTLNQAYSFLQEAEELEEEKKDLMMDKAYALLKDARTDFQDLKAQTDYAGTNLTAENNTLKEQERAKAAFIRYQSWFGYCRTLYFLGTIGEANAWTECDKQLQAYYWDYDGLEGAYYAILLRGMIFSERKNYRKAITNYAAVQDALEKQYIFQVRVENSKSLEQKRTPTFLLKEFKDNEITISGKTEWKTIKPSKVWLLQADSTYLLKLEKKMLDIYEVLLINTAMNLRSQACYYKTKAFNAQGKYIDAIEEVETFKTNYETLYNKKFIYEEYGQAAFLEQAKAYVATQEYEKALKNAQLVTEQRSYWSRTARILMGKWSLLKPDLTKDVKTIHQMAVTEWENNNYHQAVLQYLKVTQFEDTKDNIQTYVLDAWERLGQCFWYLELYLESAKCYEKLSELGEKYQKVIVNDKKKKIIDVAPKATYWSYRAYLQDFNNSKKQESKDSYFKMLSKLTSKWPSSTYALNKTFDQAYEKEKLAEKEKNIDTLQKLYEEAVVEYKNVQKEAEKFDLAQVFQGKCYLRLAERIESIIAADKKTAEEIRNISLKAKEYYIKSKEILEQYLSYIQKNLLSRLEVARNEARNTAISYAYIYLGQVYMKLEEFPQAIKTFETLMEKYADNADVVSQSQYYLCRIYFDMKESRKAKDIASQIDKKNINLDPTARESQYYSAIYNLVGILYENEFHQIEQKLQTLDQDSEDYKKYQEDAFEKQKQAANYFYKWLRLKSTAKLENYRGIANRLIRCGEICLEKNNTEESADFYKKAYPLLLKAMTFSQEEESLQRIKFQITECLVAQNKWEEALRMFYPMYHQDKDKRLEKRKIEEKDTTIQEKTEEFDLEYIDLLSNILMHFADTSEISDVDSLYPFIVKHAYRDLKDDIVKFSINNRNQSSLLEKYTFLLERIAWFQGRAWDDQNKKTINDEYKQLQNTKQHREILTHYERLYVDILDKEFKQRATTTEERNKQQEMQRICIHLAYKFSSILVTRTPTYKNRRINFGPYDNPQWWDAKYRQLYLLYLQGEHKTTKTLIETLKLQQKQMGGEKYNHLFQQLLEKLKA